MSRSGFRLIHIQAPEIDLEGHTWLSAAVTPTCTHAGDAYRAPVARLHMICGLPGAGKTTLARRLEAELDGVRLSPDEWLHRIAGEDSERADRANREHRDAVEGIQFDLALRLVPLGLNVILENGFWTRDEREGLRSRASAAGVGSTLHYLDVTVDELWLRLERRNVSLPPGTFRITRAQLDEWSTIFEPPSPSELMERL